METSSQDRIIVLVDMDCFYVQVEQKLCPEYKSKPCAVVQYNTWKGGGIIAVNYEARAKGVTRMIRGADAQNLCPDIHLFRVPEVRGKADLTRYREAGAQVLDVLCEYSDCVERASIDEAYLDMTTIINSKMQNNSPVTADELPNTFVVGWENEDPEARKVELQKWLQMIYEEEHLYNDRMLAVTAVIVEEMRTAVYEKTGYRCSAGIAHNKMLAKLSCGINKPNKQTVLPQSSIQLLFNAIPVKKVRNLGGKLGEEIVKKLNAEKMGDLFHIPKSQFISYFGEKTGHWLYNLARGIENEPVTARQLPKSIGCGKNFPGKKSLSTKDEVTYWLKQLSTELEERLLKDQESNRRVARLLTISIRNNESNGFSTVSRSCLIRVYNAEKLAYDALSAISKLNTSSCETSWKPNIWTLSMAASKFEDKLDNSHCNIQAYLVNKTSFSRKEDIAEEKTLPSASDSATAENKITTMSVTNKSKKTSNSSKSIDSFFAKKQVFIAETVINLESTSTSNNEGFNENLEEENSTLQDCCDAIDSLQDDNVTNCDLSAVVKGITFFARKQECNADSIKSEESTPEDENSNQTVSGQNLLLSNSCQDVNNLQDNFATDFSKDKLKVFSADENSSNSFLEKPTTYKIGFFAKKMAERSEFSCDMDFKAKSCDSSVLEYKKRVDVEHFPSDSHKCNLTPSASGSNKVNVSSVLNLGIMIENSPYSNLDPELTKLCNKCNKHVPIWEEEEHLDYHMAVDLSREFSTKPIDKQISVGKASTLGKSTVISKPKRTGKKRENTAKLSIQSKKPVIQSNTLDAFFKH